MTPVTLRPGRADDLELAFQIKRAAFAGYVAQVWGWNEAEQRALHGRRFAAQDVVIIQLNGDEVGLMTSTRSAGAIDLHQLFVLPAHQSRGVGAACMELLIDEARAAGLPIRLQVLKVNTRAAGFYLRLGFTATGETESHVQMEKRPEHDQRMQALAAFIDAYEAEHGEITRDEIDRATRAARTRSLPARAPAKRRCRSGEKRRRTG
jgi:GNAT superfamily N-acetyltransferase